MPKQPSAPTASLTWPQVMAWRVSRHHLDRRAPSGAMLDVTERLCGLHAQVLSSAELSLWARVDGLDETAIRDALWRDKSLVKTWVMRGTLHLLSSREYGQWQAATSTYKHYYSAAWSKYFGVDREGLDKIIAAISTALEGRSLTREELASEVTRIAGSAELGEKVRQSWGTLLKPAAFQGRLCFADSKGQNVRFTHPGGWLGDYKASDPIEAMRDVVRRYLGSYGPASREDFGRWWGLGAAEAGARIAAIGEEAVAVDVEGYRSWILARDLEDIQQSAPAGTVNLIPAFDPYVVGAVIGTPARAIAHMPGNHREKVSRPQGWISPVLLINGRMDGVWKHTETSSKVTVEISPFTSVPARAKRAAEAEAERLAAFMGKRLEVTWTKS